MTEAKNELLELAAKQFLQTIKKSGDFDISPCEGSFDLNILNNGSLFTKLGLSDAQKSQISALVQNIPSILAADSLAQAYRVEFPKGLQHTLMALKQGGFGSAIIQDGQIVGSASFYTMTAQAALTNVFTAMSIVSGMYFLVQISQQLKIIDMKLDKILEFLHEDKRAELMSEMSFVQYAYQNYASIMAHEQQRIATIVSLQEAKKVAMKNIEFYIRDLNSAASIAFKDYESLQKKIKQSNEIKERLELSQQLYVMSSILEVCFALNQDQEYIKKIKEDIETYISMCDQRMLTNFGALNGNIANAQNTLNNKGMKELKRSDLADIVQKAIDSLNGGKDRPIYKALDSTIFEPVKKAEYYLQTDGSVYMKK